jgi:hypothetical protein
MWWWYKRICHYNGQSYAMSWAIVFLQMVSTASANLRSLRVTPGRIFALGSACPTLAGEEGNGVCVCVEISSTYPLCGAIGDIGPGV